MGLYPFLILDSKLEAGGVLVFDDCQPERSGKLPQVSEFINKFRSEYVAIEAPLYRPNGSSRGRHGELVLSFTKIRHIKKNAVKS